MLYLRKSEMTKAPFKASGIIRQQTQNSIKSRIVIIDNNGKEQQFAIIFDIRGYIWHYGDNNDGVTTTGHIFNPRPI